MNTHAFNLHDRHVLFAQLRDLAATITRDPVAARSVASRVLRDFSRERDAPGTEKVWNMVPEVTGAAGEEAWLAHEVRYFSLEQLKVGPHPDDKIDPEVAAATQDHWSFYAFMYGDDAEPDEDEDVTDLDEDYDVEESFDDAA
jgi:hypothetical protein